MYASGTVKVCRDITPTGYISRGTFSKNLSVFVRALPVRETCEVHCGKEYSTFLTLESAGDKHCIYIVFNMELSAAAFRSN